jgi:uncharacterized protein DUF6680
VDNTNTLAALPTGGAAHIDFISIIAVIVGSITAVVITLWWQQRKEKRDAKLRLFLTLMAQRKSTPPTYEWVSALNLIDVVFTKHPKVVVLWHELFNMYHNPTTVESQNHKKLELLSQMAAELGFKHLQQVDIDKFFCPSAHTDQLKVNTETQAEWLRVLKNTSHLSTEMRNPDEHPG